MGCGMFYPVDQRQEPLGDGEIKYLNTLGANLFNFANALRSDMHGHLSNRIVEECQNHGLKTQQLLDIMVEVQQIFHDDPPTQDEAIRYLAPFFRGDEDFALAVYTHIKFVHAVGMATLAHGLHSMMLIEPGDPTPASSMQELYGVLKEMKYGDWEIKMMQERLTKALDAFSVEYFGKGRA